jgi:hypothetical protein
MENEITNDLAVVPSSQSNIGGVYDRINDPMLAIKTLGMSIFKSGIFGLDKPEQGEILAMQCLVEKKSPLELARTYHFIQGQLAIRSDALLAKYQMSGGKVDWITRTDKLVEAKFERNGQSAHIVASIEEYIANGTALGKDGKPKDNWKKWPRRMLTARAVSEGVRLIAPECCFGTYTVEELDAGSKTVNITPKPQTLDDLVPEEMRPAAFKVLQSVGKITDLTTWETIPDFVVQEILRKPAPFLERVKIEFNNSNV